MSSLKVLRYPPVSIIVSVEARAAPNMARMFTWSTWSGDKLVSECVCVYAKYITALWSHLVSMQSSGADCMLCKGHRVGKPEILAAAHVGCKGNCLGSHLTNVVLSCCSLCCPTKQMWVAVLVLCLCWRNLGRHWRREQSFGPEDCWIGVQNGCPHGAAHDALRRRHHGD